MSAIFESRALLLVAASISQPIHARGLSIS